jgi:hypothetical protein
MRTLIIGASSALGMAVTERLRREHADVLCIVRPDVPANVRVQLTEWGAELENGDATDPMLLPKALAHKGGREWVVVCAGGLCLSEGPEGAAARNFPGPLFEKMAPLLAARLPEKMVVAIPAPVLSQGDTVARNELFAFTDSHKRGLGYLDDEGLKKRMQVVALPPLIPGVGPLRTDDAATDTLHQLSELPAAEEVVLLDTRDAANRIFAILDGEGVAEPLSVGGTRINVARLKEAMGHGIWARAKARFLPANKNALALATHALSVEGGRAEALFGSHYQDIGKSLKAFSELVR